MSYTTQQDILDFVEDNNVKFVRFAFCDIFGFQKNIAVLASDLPKALEDGVCFDGSAIAGFMHVEESDLVLRPDLSTMTILPWRTAEGRVMQFFRRERKGRRLPRRRSAQDGRPPRRRRRRRDHLRRGLLASAQLQQDALLRLSFSHQRRIKHLGLRRFSKPFSFSYFLHQPEDLLLYGGRPLGVF